MSWTKENCIVFCRTNDHSNKVEFNKIICKDKKFKIDYLSYNLFFEFDDKFNCYKVHSGDQSFHLIHEFPFQFKFAGNERLDLTFTTDSVLVKDRSVIDYLLFIFIASISLMLLFTHLSFTNNVSRLKKVEKVETKIDQKRVVDLLKKMEMKKVVEVKKIEPKPIVESKPQPVAEPKPLAKPQPKPKVAKKQPEKPKDIKMFKVKKKIAKKANPLPLDKNLPKVKVAGKPRANAQLDALKSRLASKFGSLAKSPLGGSKSISYGNVAAKSFNNNGPSIAAYAQRGGVANKFSDSVASGVISTKGSRSIAGNASSAAGAIGGNNSVQGRVAANDLYDESYGNGGGQGFIGSGSGSFQTSSGVNASGVLKILKKFQAKFTYCYEKALISQPSLSGEMLVVWQITGSGVAKGINIKKSTLNNAQVHGCVAKVISSINFSGLGAGIIEYPFKFSASKM